MAQCTKCGAKQSLMMSLFDSSPVCEACAAKLETDDSLVPTSGGSSGTTQLGSMLIKRYKDAYTEAHAVVTVGAVIKMLGAFLGICIIVAGIAMASDRNGSSMAAIIGFSGGCIVGVPIYVLGILVAAQGQTQLATLDTAVNSSRHLNNDEVGELLKKKWSL